MKRPLVPCLCCNGSGKMQLPSSLWDTLLALKRRRNAHAAELLPFINDEVDATAINNRLERLRALGFVTRRKRSKFWIYSPK